MTDSSPSFEKSERLLTFASGGWVLLITAIMMGAVVLWRVMIIIESSKWKQGETPAAMASNGFDLSRCLVPTERVHPSGLRRDGVKAMVNPPTYTVEEANRKGRMGSKYVANRERVVGVSIGDEARAYPIRILNWHEVVNDVVGGIPIAVTYSPHADSVIVFDRRLDGVTLELGVSGLFLNANHLLFDRQKKLSESSLWSQLQGRAITGPAAGATLQTVSADLVTWDQWLEEHPETVVLAGHEHLFRKCYNHDPYRQYYSFGRPIHPVEPLPPSEEPALMTRVAVVTVNGEREVYFLPEIGAKANPEGVWRTELAGVPLVFDYTGRPETVRVRRADGGPPPAVIYSFWFTWYAASSGA